MNADKAPYVKWDGLTPPYRTIVADPPWHYDDRPGKTPLSGHWRVAGPRQPFHYSTLSVADITALPVPDLFDKGTHVYLWTTNRYLPAAFNIFEHWKVRYCQTLVWAKTPDGLGLGGSYAQTTEFVLFGRVGSLAHKERVSSTWWNFPRRDHSTKPSAFLDIVERVSPGPYVELFARQGRLGWDHWGRGYEVLAS